MLDKVEVKPEVKPTEPLVRRTWKMLAETEDRQEEWLGGWGGLLSTSHVRPTVTSKHQTGQLGTAWGPGLPMGGGLKGPSCL